MFRDRTDKVLWSLLLVTLCALCGLAASNGLRKESDQSARKGDRALERQLAYRARVELVQKLYQPVDQLRREGQLQAALLKLDELGKTYPGEAHGSILQGEILSQMGVVDEAVASYVRGIKANGDYVDARSPLSCRMQVERLVKEGLAAVKERSASQPGSVAVAQLQKNIFYLQSRLAGGCE